MPPTACSFRPGTCLPRPAGGSSSSATATAGTSPTISPSSRSCTAWASPRSSTITGATAGARGNPSEEGTYSDMAGAWRYLTESRKVPAGQILLYGQSLGGPIAAKLATEKTPAALILDSSFTSFVDIAGHHYPFLPVRWLARFEYNTLEHVKNVRCPVLVIHSPDDEIAPFSQGVALYEAAPEPKAFVKLRGGHNDALFLSAGRIPERDRRVPEKNRPIGDKESAALFLHDRRACRSRRNASSGLPETGPRLPSGSSCACFSVSTRGIACRLPRRIMPSASSNT